MHHAIRTTAMAAAMATGLSAAPVTAMAENPVGIAIVWAPEQAVAVATGRDMEQAFADAISRCVAKGAAAEDCNKTNWCAPAGWTVDVFLQHREGYHWQEFYCGLPSKTVALAITAHVCDRAERNDLIECAPVQLYDPDGTEVDIP